MQVRLDGFYGVLNKRSRYINDLHTDINKYAGQLLPELPIYQINYFCFDFCVNILSQIVGMLVGGAF